VEPVKLVLKYLDDIRETGVTRTRYGVGFPGFHLALKESRYISRLTPISGSCITALPEIKNLVRKKMDEFILTLGGDATFSVSPPPGRGYEK